MLGKYLSGAHQQLSDAPVRWQWYVNGAVRGPFTAEDMARFHDLGFLSPDSLIKQVGWERWITYAEVLRAFKSRYDVDADVALIDERAPRISLEGCAGRAVLVHDNRKLAKSLPVDLSRTGVLIAAIRPQFAVGTHVTVTVKAPGLIPSFSAEAEVIRFNADPRQRVGYALRFARIPDALRRLGEKKAA